MKKIKKLCYVCNQFRYLRGFKGKGKRRNNVCNLCLFRNSRKPIYMNDIELESKTSFHSGKTSTANELNRWSDTESYE